MKKESMEKESHTEKQTDGERDEVDAERES